MLLKLRIKVDSEMTDTMEVVTDTLSNSRKIPLSQILVPV